MSKYLRMASRHNCALRNLPRLVLVPIILCAFAQPVYSQATKVVARAMSELPSDVRISNDRIVVSPLAERFDDWRARYGASEELEDFIESIKRRESIPLRYVSNVQTNLAKSVRQNSLFNDMELLPGQDFVNTSGYSYATLVQLQDGRLAVAYKDWGISGPDFFGPPDVSPRVLFQTSADGGETWSEPTVVADNADFILDFNFLNMAVAASGRLVLIDETPLEANHVFYSDDGGATWTEGCVPRQGCVPDFDSVADRIVGPVDGLLWHPRTDYDTGKIEYFTSTDGESWTGPNNMLTMPSGSEGTLEEVAHVGGQRYVALFNYSVFDPCCSQSVGISTSEDNGANWSTIRQISSGDLDLRANSMVGRDDGTLYISAQGRVQSDEFVPDDIYYAVSTDGGTTFSDFTPFTRYVGADYLSDMAFPGGSGGEPIAAFTSERVGAQAPDGGIFYGIVGVTPDVDPPPGVFFDRAPGGWVPAGEPTTLRVLARDEAGLTGVEARYTRGETSGTFPMFDDGAHDDEEAGDGIWAGEIGPFDFGPSIEVIPVATDLSGQEGGGLEFRFQVAAWHNAGNVSLAMTKEGAIGQLWLQDNGRAAGRWPADDGFNYVWSAGLWVGAETDAGKQVMHLFIDNGFGPEGPAAEEGDWAYTAAPVLVQDRSDRDIILSYDDSGAPQPIGIDVAQRSFQWASTDYIIFEFELSNTSGGDLDAVYPAFYMDVDVPMEFDASDDKVAYDAQRALVYGFDSGNSCTEFEAPEFCTDTYAGIQLLDDGLGKSAVEPFTATRWLVGQDPGRSADGLDRHIFGLITSGIHPVFNRGLATSPNDWRILLASQPVAIAAGASVKVGFGLVFGSGLEGLQANSDAMAAAYQNEVVSVERVDPVPREFVLGQNYPNPFNPSTTIPFSVEKESAVTVALFDVLGRAIMTVVDEHLAPGSYTVTVDGKGLPSGTYYYTLRAGEQVQTRSMFLMK